MKLILSRKGFDSGVGRVASPILPSGRLCSLPIPDKRGVQCYSEICFHSVEDGVTGLVPLVTDLTHGRLDAETPTHLDPDLRPESLPRRPGWRPVFGQTGAAQGHLRQQGIGPGDLFLFYGWFRQVEHRGGRLRYVANAPDLHVLFGWLQIGEIISLASSTAQQPHGTSGSAIEEAENGGKRQGSVVIPAWARYHPHVVGDYGFNNTLYVAADRLMLPRNATTMPGAGVFPHLHTSLQLTAAGGYRSIWRLPGWFMPVNGRTPLSYHRDRARWQRDGDEVLLRTVGRGQEFVLNCDEYPEAAAWIAGLVYQTSRYMRESL